MKRLPPIASTILLALLCIGQVPAQDKPASKGPAGLLGEWEGSIEGGGSSQAIVWRFQSDEDGNLTGFMGPERAGAVLPMAKLTTTQDKLSFELTSQGKFSGTIGSDKISGTWTGSDSDDQKAAVKMVRKTPQEKTPRILLGSDRTWLGTAESRTASIASGDLDGDGDADIVVGNGRHWPQRNRIFFNNGIGRFTKSVFLGETHDTTYKVLIVDTDGDSDLDIIVGNESLENMVYLNDGKGNFRVGCRFGDLRRGVRDLVAIDFNGDNHLDIIEFTRMGPNISYLNDGAGNLKEFGSIGAPRDSIGAAAAGKLNGDSSIDLVLVDRDGGANHVYFGRKGGFQSPTPFGRDNDDTHDVAIADMNGDGINDIIAASIEQPNQVYLGSADHRFKTSVSFGEKSRSYAIVTGDLDNDGDIDVVVGNHGGRNIAYFNKGDGKSFQRLVFGPKSYTYDIGLADLNGDGFLDVIVANSDAHNQCFFNLAPGK